MTRREDQASRSISRALNRRDFLKRSSLAPLVGLIGVDEGHTAPRPSAAAHPPLQGQDPIHCALIGFGPWGREIAATLGRMPEARVAAVVDTYDVMLKRAERDVPQAATHADYRAVLDDPAIQSILIATPTHLHRQIVIDALQAGKHVYCEAPLASTVEDAAAIVRAAQAVPEQIFQSGLPYRSNPQYRAIYGFIHSGALGKPVLSRAQWHAKQSWRRASPNREREREQNWRLDPDYSAGLIGEVGLHQLDTASWFLQGRPEAVTGFGSIRLWDDGREVPDTVQAVFEFPGGLNMMYDATLASSFDSMYDVFHGSDSTIMIRDAKAWMFKEVDAPMLGWEVYARKDKFYKEQGIALAANATQLDAQGQDPAADDPNIETPLFYALKEFIENHHFGPYPPSAGALQGYEATVIALKANEAVLKKERIVLEDALFDPTFTG